MKILIIVDMQNDFIDGSLGTKEAQAIVPNVVKKLENYKNTETIVIFTKDTHYNNYLETEEGLNLPREHCIFGTDGWCIKKEIANIIDYGSFYTFSCDVIKNYRVIKNTFGSLDLANTLKDFCNYHSIETIELIGLCTDICVISNALLLKAACPEIPIIVDASCCAGVTPESHKNALEAMKMCQIKIINEEV